MIKRTLTLLLLCAAAALPLQARKKPVWTPVMPVEFYKELTLEQRAQVDKALKLYEKGGSGKNRKEQQLHKSAANEWERFRVQYADSIPDELFGYSLFMQAMAQQRAADRHTAVRTYTEVLDFYPSTVWLAAPALYNRAKTHEEIGDLKKAYQDYTEITKDPAYSQHALAGYALMKVSDNHWENKREKDAVRMWEKLREEFKEKNPPSYDQAGQRLYDRTLVTGDFEAARNERVERQTRGSEEERFANATKEVFLRVQGSTYKYYDSWYFKPHMGDKKKGKAQKKLIEDSRNWFIAQANVFSAVNRDWEFMLMRFDDLARYDKKAMEKFIPELSAYLQKTGDPKVKKERAKTLISKLSGIKQYNQAMALLPFIPEVPERLWTEYGLYQTQKKYEDCERVLDQLASLKDSEQAQRILTERASLYHRNMGKYEEAIKLYHQINDPENTLWEITDCYRKMGQKDRAQETLTEIASIFPNLAARAVLQKAEFYRSDGAKESAIGLYRNLLAHPEWKKTGEASRAHDRLEDLGIATGGAVLNEVN